MCKGQKRKPHQAKKKESRNDILSVVIIKKSYFVTFIFLSFVIFTICGTFSSRIIQAISDPHSENIYSEKNFNEESYEGGYRENYEEREEHSEDDEDSEDDEEYDLMDDRIERLHEIPGMSHQIVGLCRGLKSSFLSSGDDLLNVMKLVTDEAGLTSLSMQCTLTVRGLFCDSILADRSHILVNTILDDSSGLLTFNILLSGKKQITIEHNFFAKLSQIFSMHYIDEVFALMDKFYIRNIPTINWKLGTRNDPNADDSAPRVRNPYFDDLACDERYLGNIYVLSKHIDSIETPFQRIDVYDFVDAKYTSHISNFNSIIGGDPYEAQNPELFEANRVIFLDGVMQSTSRGNEAYHEALVQPAMFAHNNPCRVAIIGGGEGATLREALKHKSVEKVLMIDIDENMCKESARLLYPAWNSCDELFNSNQSCFDDPRSDVRYEDAFAWFINRYSLDKDSDKQEYFAKLDIIIMDALDPQDTVGFASVLYQNLVFWQSIYNALTDDGILVAQLGDAPMLLDPADTNTDGKNRQLVIENLEEVGFQSMHVYEESHAGFEDPWTFLVACKSTVCRSNWYRSSAEVDIQIHRRILRSKSGLPLLKYFDGPTMSTYHVPHKAVESVYCRIEPTPQDCAFDQKLYRNQGEALNSVGKIVSVSSTAILLFKSLEAYVSDSIKNFIRLFNTANILQKENFYLKVEMHSNTFNFETVTKSNMTEYYLRNSTGFRRAAYAPVLERRLSFFANLLGKF